MPDNTDRILTAGEDAFHRFACALADDLPLIATLLDAHPAAGDCTGCRLPGPQRPVPAPCGVRVVALLALQIRVLRETEAAEDCDDRLITYLGGGGDPGDDDLGVLLGRWVREVNS